MSYGSESDGSSAVRPFLKWPGGKRWIAPFLARVLRAELRGRYYEPFVGAGATFLALRPRLATLSDANGELVSFLRIVRRFPEAVVDGVHRLSNSRECYYDVRASIPRTQIGMAARFLYLNRTCWAGLYRTNRDGEFNVPFGDSGRTICSRSAVVQVAKQFRGARLEVSDFQPIIESATKGDVVYADPPYTTRGRNNGFIRYNENLFSWSDQVRLCECCRSAARRGVFVVVSGNCHADVLELYKGWWMQALERKSVVSRQVSKRSSVAEVLLFSRRPRLRDERLDVKRVNDYEGVK